MSGNPWNFQLFLILFRYGSPYIELTDTSYIVGGGYTCSIEYKGKGWLSGKSHTFKAVLTPISKSSSLREHVVDGLWHTTSKYSSGPFSGSDFHDVDHHSPEMVTAIGGEPDGEMGDWETRKLWKLVAKGIREGDFETASREKSKIEVQYLICPLLNGILTGLNRMSNGREERMRQPPVLLGA